MVSVPTSSSSSILSLRNVGGGEEEGCFIGQGVTESAGQKILSFEIVLLEEVYK